MGGVAYRGGFWVAHGATKEARVRKAVRTLHATKGFIQHWRRADVSHQEPKTGHNAVVFETDTATAADRHRKFELRRYRLSTPSFSRVVGTARWSAFDEHSKHLLFSFSREARIGAAVSGT